MTATHSLRRDGRVTALRVRRACSLRSRLVGLIGRGALEPDQGLWITPCNSVHTCFMTFPIDVVFLDARLRVVRVRPALPPWRAAWGGWKARHALELAAGAARRTEIRVGVRLELADDE